MRILESYAEPGSKLEQARCRRARAVRRMQYEVGHLADIDIADLRKTVPEPAAEAEREIIFARRGERRLGRAGAEVRELGHASLEVVHEVESARAAPMDERHELRDVGPRGARGDAARVWIGESRDIRQRCVRKSRARAE